MAPVIFEFEGFEVDTRGWEAAEVRSQRTVRWWTTEELTCTREAVYPDNLLELITRADIQARD